MAARRRSGRNADGERRTKQRHDAASSSSGPQEPEAQPGDLPFGYLLDDSPSEHARFIRDFVDRPLCQPKSLDTDFFTAEGFRVVAQLEGSHLRQMAEMLCPYSEVMVRAFYHNLSYINGELRSRVCGIDIVMTAPVWLEILGYDFDHQQTVSYDGESSAIIPGFVRADAVEETRRLDIRRGHTVHYTVGLLSVDARILHYVITHILFPRAFNHSRVLEGDIPILWAIRHGVNINWRHYICSMMYKAKHKGHLPFAFLIHKILMYFHVPMHTEVMKRPSGYTAKFGQRLLEQCKISKNNAGVWQYTRGVEVEIPDVHAAAPIVEPEADDDDDDDDDMADPDEIVEPEGGFSLRDVMKGFNATLKKLGKMSIRQKKWRKSHIQKGNERFKHIQARFKGVEDRLGRLELREGRADAAAAVDQDEDDAVSDEEDEETDTDDGED